MLNIRTFWLLTIFSRLAIFYNLNSTSFFRLFPKPVSTICLIQLLLHLCTFATLIAILFLKKSIYILHLYHRKVLSLKSYCMCCNRVWIKRLCISTDRQAGLYLCSRTSFLPVQYCTYELFCASWWRSTVKPNQLESSWYTRTTCWRGSYFWCLNVSFFSKEKTVLTEEVFLGL